MTEPRLLQACLNGSRRRGEHSRLPITAAELASDAMTAIDAGATCLHVHPRGADGNETLERSAVAATLGAIRAVVDVPISVSTGAWIVPDSAARIDAIRCWEVLPDSASVNVHEDGAIAVAELLLTRGTEIEVGVWTAAAAHALISSGIVEQCGRILIEPMDSTYPDAVVTIAAIEQALAAAAVPRLLHGQDSTAWAILDVALGRGYDIRMGFEDTLRLRDGSIAQDNAALVRDADSSRRRYSR